MRKTSWCLFLIVTLVLIAGFLTACARNDSRRERPQAVQGTLDLRAWNFAQQGPVPLNGEWEFYWQRHLEPSDFAQPSPPVRTGFIDVPGIWNGYTVKGIGEGTGMGLAMVHGIVTSYGGAVTVESTPGEGSTFIVDLPRMAEAVEAIPSDPFDTGGRLTNALGERR
jgi:hypothetical protein